MLNKFLSGENNSWNPKEDRPVDSFIFIALILSTLFFKLMINNKITYYECIIYTTVILLLSILIYLTLNKTFKKLNQPDKLVFLELTQENLSLLMEELKIRNITCCTEEDLKKLSKGEKLNTKIIWDHKAQNSKQVTYTFLFQMFHEYLIKDGIKNGSKSLPTDKKNNLLNYIVNNFGKKDVPDFEIKKENLNKSYCEWIPPKK
ncbi:hypothetical protein V3470_13745 [Flavobacterium oreochromis]|uniref:Uncharacterized protein n=1 Tax=Flavobacterium oreochromis TaxID=2906078 RepID=A0ABW8PBX8_9FLAO|nr:hypothetical protein [Flavobacterium oreochromis]OWP75187.1 hypothetical protein BWG23_11645 [Flavobacterium oreochromis]